MHAVGAETEELMTRFESRASHRRFQGAAETLLATKDLETLYALMTSLSADEPTSMECDINKRPGRTRGSPAG